MSSRKDNSFISISSAGACPDENSSGYDANADGCIDDSDNDGVKDNDLPHSQHRELRLTRQAVNLLDVIISEFCVLILSSHTK